MGQYLSQDPIGLAGNNPTLYGYVSDTNSWVDIFGLISFFRAVFEAEYKDIINNNVVRNIGGQYETTKLFATTEVDAMKYGDLLQQLENGNKYYILEVDAPDGLKMDEFTADRMDAVGIKNEDLDKLKIIKCK